MYGILVRGCSVIRFSSVWIEVRGLLDYISHLANVCSYLSRNTWPGLNFLPSPRRWSHAAAITGFKNSYFCVDCLYIGLLALFLYSDCWFQEFFTSFLSPRRIWWTIKLLHLLSISLFATFQVFQILSSSSNLVFSNCVVVTLIYFGPVSNDFLVNLFWSFLYVCPIHCDALFWSWSDVGSGWYTPVVVY